MLQQFVILTTLAFAAASALQARTPADEMAILLEGCGETKACFAARSGCVANGNCTVAASVQPRAGAYRFEMRSLRGIYVSVALSTDTKMGNDAVVECVYDEATQQVDAFVSWNQGHSNSRQDTPATELGVTLESGSYVDQSVSCSFSRLATTSLNGTTFALDDTPYYLLLAAGTKLKETGAIGRHDVLDAASQCAQLLGSPGMFDCAAPGSAQRALPALPAFAALLALATLSKLGVAV